MKLEIQNIRVSYDTETVLQNMSLSVREGEFLSLLGPSGCYQPDFPVFPNGISMCAGCFSGLCLV